MQKQFQLDIESLKKIGKGALIAGAGAAAVAILSYFGDLEYADPTVAALVGSLVSIGVNAIREYIKGV